MVFFRDETQNKRWIELAPDMDAPLETPIPPDRPLPEHLDFGVVAVDKPSGPTSHDVVDRVRRILRIDKAGHGGTLDPNATGVLPVFLGRATKLSSLSLHGGKTYSAVARFHRDVDSEALEGLARDYLGEISQLPPVRSRVKREIRTREIYDLAFSSLAGRDVLLHVSCEAGTYVRKLIHDMGQTLGTGAHMTGLRRIRAGCFQEEDAVDLDGLEAAYRDAREGSEDRLRRWIAPAESLASLLPRFVLDPGAARAVARGAKLAKVGLFRFEVPLAKSDRIALLAGSGEWVALGMALEDGDTITTMKSGLVAAPKRVLMPGYLA